MNKFKNITQQKKLFKNLIKKICKNAQEGLEEFFNIYGRFIYASAKAICRTDDKTNEVVNDVLIKIWRTAKTIKEIDNPEGWLYIITVNMAKNRLKDKKYVVLNENIIDEKDAFEELINFQSFYYMIENLSENEKQIMIHKFVSGRTFQEIAIEMQKPLSSITSIYYRALEKIQNKL